MYDICMLDAYFIKLVGSNQRASAKVTSIRAKNLYINMPPPYSHRVMTRSPSRVRRVERRCSTHCHGCSHSREVQQPKHWQRAGRSTDRELDKNNNNARAEDVLQSQVKTLVNTHPKQRDKAEQRAKQAEKTFESLRKERSEHVQANEKCHRRQKVAEKQSNKHGKRVAAAESKIGKEKNDKHMMRTQMSPSKPMITKGVLLGKIERSQSLAALMQAKQALMQAKALGIKVSLFVRFCQQIEKGHVPMNVLSSEDKEFRSICQKKLSDRKGAGEDSAYQTGDESSDEQSTPSRSSYDDNLDRIDDDADQIITMTTLPVAAQRGNKRSGPDRRGLDSNKIKKNTIR